jgi:hypothetical protein
MFEIYNEEVIDLLLPDSPESKKPKVKFNSDTKNFYVEGLSQHPIESL